MVYCVRSFRNGGLANPAFLPPLFTSVDDFEQARAQAVTTLWSSLPDAAPAVNDRILKPTNRR